MTDSEIRIVTHSGEFHADDVFAVATLLLHLDKDVDGVQIIRSREEGDIEKGDYVVDVGFVYDPGKKLFDHHQRGGAGTRQNGIDYASFGLVWKEYGEEIAGDREIAEVIEKKVVIPIDASDTGTGNINCEVAPGIWFYTVQTLVQSYLPLWGSNQEKFLVAFKKVVPIAKEVIENEVKHARQEESARKKIVKAYKESDNKEILVFEDAYGWSRIFISLVLNEFPEPVYFIRQHYDGNWQLVCVQEPYYKNRKSLPESWRGLTGEELQEVTGVEDAVFCHNSGFMCVAESKDSALKLAEISLES